MINLLGYNDSELYDQVQNTEYFYNECESIEDESGINNFIQELEETFIFNSDQQSYIENEIRGKFLTFDIIVESFVNGNMKQTLSQIEEFDRYDFVLELENLSDLELKNEIAFFVLEDWS